MLTISSKANGQQDSLFQSEHTEDGSTDNHERNQPQWVQKKPKNISIKFLFANGRSIANGDCMNVNATFVRNASGFNAR